MTRTDYDPRDFETDDPEAARTARLKVAALTCLCAVWCAPQPDSGKVKAMVHAETSESAFRRGPTEYAAETQRRVRLMFGPIGGAA